MTVKITEEIREAFKPVLDWLDAGGKHVFKDKDGKEKTWTFEMTFWNTSDPEILSDMGYPCGTAMCIGGALAHFNSDVGETLTYEETKIPDIDNAKREFSPLFFPEDNGGLDYATITPQWAAATIRHMLETGEIDWWGNKP